MILPGVDTRMCVRLLVILYLSTKCNSLHVIISEGREENKHGSDLELPETTPEEQSKNFEAAIDKLEKELGYLTVRFVDGANEVEDPNDIPIEATKKVEHPVDQNTQTNKRIVRQATEGRLYPQLHSNPNYPAYYPTKNTFPHNNNFSTPSYNSQQRQPYYPSHNNSQPMYPSHNPYPRQFNSTSPQYPSHYSERPAYPSYNSSQRPPYYPVRNNSNMAYNNTYHNYPSYNPSQRPPLNPSYNNSNYPTYNPSQRPSYNPTKNPFMPGRNSSFNPSVNNTNQNYPSFNPNHRPSYPGNTQIYNGSRPSYPQSYPHHNIPPYNNSRPSYPSQRPPYYTNQTPYNPSQNNSPSNYSFFNPSQRPPTHDNNPYMNTNYPFSPSIPSQRPPIFNPTYNQYNKSSQYPNQFSNQTFSQFNPSYNNSQFQNPYNPNQGAPYNNGPTSNIYQNQNPSQPAYNPNIQNYSFNEMDRLLFPGSNTTNTNRDPHKIPPEYFSYPH